MNKSIIFFDVTTKLINPIDEVFIDKKLVEIFIDYDKSIDKILTNIINENLVIEEYTNIILPACFGKVLADFLGLRFAAHIRCTPGINQHKNIFLYSFNGIKDYFSSESFNILKTEGVFLIDYDVNTIINKSLDKIEYLSKEKIINEVKKINLQIPANYEDNHSIVNEWAIYRWSQAINASDDSIDKITNIQNSNLYFKYLKTIYPMSKVDIIQDSELKLNFEGNPTILYIDDEADKGWKEIFETLFYEKNENIDFFHLDNELNDKTKKEISELTIKTIMEENVDVVILDFRLHKDDFECKKIEEVTGYQILKKIKDHNKGIQVIIFSATNKIWNFQALQEAGADGFIIKEAPEKSINNDFTEQSIENLKKSLEQCINKIFLKEIYAILTPLIEKVALNKNKQPNKYSLRIQQGKLKNYLDYLKSADLLLYSNPNNLKYTFLQLILIIEDIIKSFYINSNDGNHYVEISLTEKKICIEKSSSQIILKLNPIEKWSRFSFQDYLIQIPEEFSLFNAQADRIPFNYRLNCVLHFKYNIVLEQSSIYSGLYRLRSSSVAHIGNSDVKKEDILNSIELLNILIN